MNGETQALRDTPRIAAMRVIPVAGHDNLVRLTDNAGHTGLAKRIPGWQFDEGLQPRAAWVNADTSKEVDP